MCVFVLGYKEIVVIPASATNINIQETSPLPHFLGTRHLQTAHFHKM